MTAACIGIEGAIGALENAAGKMSLRVWMELNREELLRVWNGRQLNWGALCSWFKEVGLTNATGAVPSVHCAKMTWYRVGKSLAARQARASAEADRVSRERATRHIETTAKAEQNHTSEDVILALMTEADHEEKLNRERRDRIAAYRAEAAASAEKAPEHSVAAPSPAVDQDVPPQLHATEEVVRPPVKIGQIANHVTMLEQAPRYGKDKDKPLPPPYVGPRPDGMPEYLPFEALMPLDATGRQPDGRIDYEALPGLPRRSFFEDRHQWAKACIPMVEAIPAEDRTLILQALLDRARGILRSLY